MDITGRHELFAESALRVRHDDVFSDVLGGGRWRSHHRGAFSSASSTASEHMSVSTASASASASSPSPPRLSAFARQPHHHRGHRHGHHHDDLNIISSGKSMMNASVSFSSACACTSIPEGSVPWCLSHWGTSPDVSSEVCSDQFILVRDELYDRVTVHGLTTALMKSSSLSSVAGHHHSDEFSVVDIDIAIAVADELGIHSVEAEKLYRTALLMRSVREARRHDAAETAAGADVTDRGTQHHEHAHAERVRMLCFRGGQNVFRALSSVGSLKANGWFHSIAGVEVEDAFYEVK